MARFRAFLRVWLVAAVAVFGALRASAAGQIQLAQPNAAAFPQIRLYVYATGENGRPLAGITASDLEVREDNHVVPIESLRDATRGTPLEICLAIDRSGSMLAESKLPSAKEAAALFLRSLRPQDRAALISFSDRATLERSLTRDAAGLAQAVAKMEPFGGTALYDAVYWSVSQVALAPRAQGSVLTRPARADARRVVLALTDGNDNRSRATPAQVIDLARANGVTIYTIGLGSDADGPALDRLARGTGGRYFPAPGPQALAELYAFIARQLHSEYAIAYRTPNPDRDGSRRQVTVTLRTPAGTATAAGWYQAPGAGSSVIAAAPSAADTGTSPLSGRPPPVAAPRSRPSWLWLLVPAAAAAGLVAYLVWRGRADAAIDPQAAPAPSPAAERTLLHTNPRIDLRPLWVRLDVTAVGRAEENDFVIPSPMVSRRHARIERANGEYRVVDVGSANGTYVNGERVTAAPIAVGDIVRFADQEFRFAGEIGLQEA